MSRFPCIKIIDSNGKKFGYNEHPLRTNSFFCIIFSPLCFIHTRNLSDVIVHTIAKNGYTTHYWTFQSTEKLTK